jgi:hypothetical protein
VKENSIACSVLLGATCVAVLCGILTAGLWPFHAPHNEVNWLANQDGLHFGKNGSIVSAGTVQVSDSEEMRIRSLEIWLQPDASMSTQTILGFYDANSPVAQLSLHQYHEDLLIRREITISPALASHEKLEYGDVFFPGKPVFVTITAGVGDTRVYVNGAFVGMSPTFTLARESMNGRLVLANSPIDNDSWAGKIFGLAVYGQELPSSQVAQHYRDWIKTRRPQIAGSEAPIAFYLFNERKGDMVHDSLGAAPSLLIPEHYFVLHPHFLQSPWSEFRFRWYYFQDVIINITGFVPFGFLFCAYFASVWRIKRPAFATILCGFAISLTIEVSQTFLPTRESGMTDVLTNSLGTGLGALLCQNPWSQSVLASIGIGTDK